MHLRIRCRLQQARSQLGTQGGAKGFLRGAQIFELCPIVLNHVQHIFPGGAKIFLGGIRPPPGYGPGLQDLSNHGKSREQKNSILKKFGGVIAVDTVGNTNQKKIFSAPILSLMG